MFHVKHFFTETNGRKIVLDGKRWTKLKAECKRDFDTSSKSFEILWKAYKSLLSTGMRGPSNISDLWSTLSSIHSYLLKNGQIKY